MRIEMKMQFATIKRCFTDCVKDFHAGELTANEKSWIQNCAARDMECFIKMATIMQSQQQSMGGQRF